LFASLFTGGIFFLKNASKNDIINMTRKEKVFLKLLTNPSDATIQEIQQILENHGYKLKRITGSHHIFTKPYCNSYNFPIHNNKIKKIYINKLMHEFYKDYYEKE